MKTITIGRGPENMVTLNDAKTSRRHALLRCYPMGKMEIVDQSKNGTFVNGMRIPSSKPYPLTRKDIVIFAHAEALDWNEVPNPYKYVKYLTIVLVVCIIALATGIGTHAFMASLRTSTEDAHEYVEPSASANDRSTATDSIQGSKKKGNFVFPKKGKAKEQKNKTEEEEDKAVPAPPSSSVDKQKENKNKSTHEKEMEEGEMDVIN